MNTYSRTPKKHRRHGGLILFLCILLVLGAVGGYLYATGEDHLYALGVQMLESGQYWEAVEVFERLPEHPQSAARISEANYAIATQLLENRQYADARERFAQLADYSDSVGKVRQCDYNLGLQAKENGDHQAAYDYFIQAGGYQNAAVLAQQMLYEIGHAAFAAGDFDAAEVCFAQLTDTLNAYGYPHFRTLPEAAVYLEQQRLEQKELIHFYVGQEPDEEFYDTLRTLFPCQYYDTSYTERERQITISAIHYYAGDNILYALRTGDDSGLTSEEQQVMALALQLVAQAEAETESPLELEIWLHDWLCKQVRYESPNMDVERDAFVQLRELTCVGAMLDGIANCQGYADAFYLLGNLAGLDVGRIMGYTEEGHIWNTIRLDGQLYIVDVTFNDLSDEELDGWTYTHFNIFWDPSVYDPMGDDAASPAVTTQVDLRHTYFNHTGSICATLEDAARNLAEQHVSGEKTWTYALVENVILAPEAVNEALKPILQQYYRGFSWTLWVEHYGGNSSITICWKSA